jgi:hypothetical protein
VLVLTDDELRSAPGPTLTRLWDFAGLPHVDLAGLTPAALSRRFETMFPNFGSTSGWRLDGGYGAMPEPERAELVRLYHPYNLALYDYVGRDLGWMRP